MFWVKVEGGCHRCWKYRFTSPTWGIGAKALVLSLSAAGVLLASGVVEGADLNAATDGSALVALGVGLGISAGAAAIGVGSAVGVSNVGVAIAVGVSNVGVGIGGGACIVGAGIGALTLARATATLGVCPGLGKNDGVGVGVERGAVRLVGVASRSVRVAVLSVRVAVLSVRVAERSLLVAARSVGGATGSGGIVTARGGF